jgi:predicted SAM-dependent methyltransferase
MIKINVGSGNKPKNGYRNLDKLIGKHIYYENTDAWDIPEPNNSIDEIYTRHFLEHLDPIEADKTLIEFKRILKNDGLLHIIVPNISFHCKQFFMKGKSNFANSSNYEHAMAGLYGWVNKGTWMGHKWGYTKKTLSDLLKKHKFKNIRIIDCRECDIEIKANK